ncbi:hypothetical protein NMY22_g14521 [Coprinellus aureogranulatus]|nr:hypothetical protein NMY22_g14521 [Coprinellus aureogranulatus]
MCLARRAQWHWKAPAGSIHPDNGDLKANQQVEDDFKLPFTSCCHGSLAVDGRNPPRRDPGRGFEVVGQGHAHRCGRRKRRNCLICDLPRIIADCGAKGIIGRETEFALILRRRESFVDREAKEAFRATSRIRLSLRRCIRSVRRVTVGAFLMEQIEKDNAQALQDCSSLTLRPAPYAQPGFPSLYSAESGRLSLP